MTKKLMSVIVLLSLLLSLTACFGEKPMAEVITTEPTTETTTVSEETTEPTTEPSLTPTGPEETYPDQLAVIVENRALWLTNEELFAPMCNYTVADFDRNGRLEIWFGACMGTGLFTYMYAWELSEDLTALVALERDYDEYFSQSDMMVGDADVYYDEDTRSYYYIFQDSNRGGWAWSGTDVRALLVKNGTLSEMTLASLSLDTDENYVSTTTYYDALGNEISEADYETAAERHFADLHKMQAFFLWQSIEENEIESIDDETLLTKLQEALDAFSVS